MIKKTSWNNNRFFHNKCHFSACFERTASSLFLTKPGEILFPIPQTAQNCTHMYPIYILVNNLIEIGSITCMSIARNVIKKANESYYSAAPIKNQKTSPFYTRFPHQLHCMRSWCAIPHSAIFTFCYCILNLCNTKTEIHPSAKQ